MDDCYLCSSFRYSKELRKNPIAKASKNETDTVKNWQQPEETESALLSKLEDNKRCYLCGSSDYSMMDYYRKLDTIGLISLNDWHVLNFQLKNYDENG